MTCSCNYPISASDDLVELWRIRAVELFAQRKLVNADFAKKLLSWKHSGISIESNTRIYTDSARESLCQYLVRSPVAIEKLYWDDLTDTILWHAPKKGHFRGEDGYFTGIDFIARVTLHIPPKGA